jgi:YafQ family addiction module toxin component
MYEIENSTKIVFIFKKLSKKNPKQLEAIMEKLAKVVENPRRFKPLSNVMKGRRRLHFGSFVLVYSIDEINKVVKLIDYDHHDNIYRKQN